MTRLSPDDRRAAILSAAVDLAVREGYRALTRDKVAEEAQTSTGLVSRYFYHMDLLRAAVLDEAVKRHDVRLVTEGLACGDLSIHTVPRKLRIRAAMSLFGGAS